MEFRAAFDVRRCFLSTKSSGFFSHLAQSDFSGFPLSIFRQHQIGLSRRDRSGGGGGRGRSGGLAETGLGGVPGDS